MKYLLTSSGISNDSIRNVLVDLLGKPIAESSALCIPTAAYACPGGAVMAWQFLRGVALSPLCELGWKSLGVLELTALPSIKEEQWVPLVQEADALLVWGGDSLYLCYWMRQSGVADLLPSLRETVYVGVSAGSMVVTPNFGEAYDSWFCREPSQIPRSNLPTSDDRALGLVDFSLFPHLDHEKSPENSLANAERWATKVPVPTYAIDDQTATRLGAGMLDCPARSRVKRPSRLEEFKNVLRAQCCPKSEELMIRIGEGSTTADRHETRVVVFREDHTQHPLTPRHMMRRFGCTLELGKNAQRRAHGKIRAKAGLLPPSHAEPSGAPRLGWRAVRERGSVEPHVPARGAGCTRRVRNSSRSPLQAREKCTVGVLSRLTKQQTWSGTSGGTAPNRDGVHPWG